LDKRAPGKPAFIAGAQFFSSGINESRIPATCGDMITLWSYFSMPLNQALMVRELASKVPPFLGAFLERAGLKRGEVSSCGDGRGRPAATQPSAYLWTEAPEEELTLDHIDRIMWKGEALAYIIRNSYEPSSTEFLTPPEFKQQVGYVVYPEGGVIRRHMHRKLERRLVGTSEVLIVRKGCCEIDVFNDEKQLVASHKLYPGDIMLMVGGGHGFRMLEDTIFLEVKQGPYTGQDEKELF
jgi:hypothetical protein